MRNRIRLRYMEESIKIIKRMLKRSKRKAKREKRMRKMITENTFKTFTYLHN